MAKVQESEPLPEVDLDKTDELPVLDMMKLSAPDMDPATLARLDSASTTSDTDRQPRVDLPALIDSVQQAEARIAQQAAHQETLERDLKSARDRIEESAREMLRLGGEAQALRTTLGAREDALAQALHTVGERDHSVAELRRQQSELQQRIAEAAQATAKLKSEFAANESFLQDEHEATRTRLTDELIATRTQLSEELAQTRTKLGRELGEARSQIEAGQRELQSAQNAIADLNARMAQGEQALAIAQREAALFKRQSTEFLENLRSQEWRRHHGESLFREMDSRLAAVQTESEKFAAQAGALSSQLAEAQAQSEAQVRSICALESSLAKSEDTVRRQEAALQSVEQTRQNQIRELEQSRQHLARELEQSRARLSQTEQQLQAALAAAEAQRQQAQASAEQERDRWSAEIATRDRSLQEERESRAQLQTQVDSLQAAQAEHLARIADIDQMLSGAQQQKKLDDETLQQQAASLDAARTELAAQHDRVNLLEGELGSASAQLNEVRRPIEEAEAEIRQLRVELEGKSRDIEQSREEVKHLQNQLERSKGALEEREFLIRRLERSANTSAQVLGRLQSSIERLGTAPVVAPPEPPPVAAPFAPTLIRIDNGLATTYALGQRTRVGRSPESEIRIESSSVSRHHALIITSPRHIIIEDLNSTNGVAINGRKVSRHRLKDGDVIVIGDAQFKFVDSGALLAEPNPVSFAPS
ncbi:MAG: FHA domain-containing protein [Proteobacteria bacterium]|nr:FHA domain-containing protein [Pseudomonadota bacterium]